MENNQCIDEESLQQLIEEARGEYRTQKIEDFTDLRVWQDSMDLAEKIYRLSSVFPDSERYGLTQQVRKCAVSIPSNISEGQSRGGPKEFIRFLGIARGSASELRTQVLLAQRLGYCSPEAGKQSIDHIL